MIVNAWLKTAILSKYQLYQEGIGTFDLRLVSRRVTKPSAMIHYGIAATCFSRLRSGIQEILRHG